MEKPRLKTIVKRIPNGVTEPLLCILNNEAQVVFKYYNNVQGNHTLANEWIGYNLARRVGLTMPESGICILDERVELPERMDGIFDRELQEHIGFGFYSTHILKTVPLTNPEIIRRMDNRDEIPRLILFDHFIHNMDRNPGNLLFSYGKQDKKMYVIDHTHIFPNATIWDCISLRRSLDENEHLSRAILERNSKLYNQFWQVCPLSVEALEKACSHIRLVLPPAEINNILMSVPPEWGINESEVEGLFDFLCTQLIRLDETCDMIMREMKEVGKNE